jgi:hypothetical protein
VQLELKLAPLSRSDWPGAVENRAAAFGFREVGSVAWIERSGKTGFTGGSEVRFGCRDMLGLK